MSAILRVSDLLARAVPIDWFEAVALVRDVSDRVRESVGGRGVPDLDQVQLLPEGHVSLTGVTKSDDPVRRLGQLLQACLAQADPPVQLRLAVTQATAPEPGYSSIRELSEALAYFERPNRELVLQELYSRAISAPDTSSPAELTLDTIAPLDTYDSARDSKPQNARRRRVSARAIAALATGVLVVAAATAYSQFSSVAPLQADVSGLALNASDAVGTTLVKGISAVSEKVGLGRLVPAEGSGAPPTASVPATQAVRKPAHIPKPMASKSKYDGRSFRIFDLEILPVVAGIPAAVGSAAVDLGDMVPVAPSPTLVDDQPVYSSDDPTVMPPVGVRPQLPRVLPSDITPDRLSRIELVVLPDGTVGSVKLLGGDRGVIQGMLLSAAKAWKFKPAEKDGRPVAYRKIVWLARE